MTDRDVVVGPERVLDALDDEAIREYLDGN